MNICYCGSGPSFPHAADCPYPLYRGTDSQAVEWQAARLQIRAIQRRQARYYHLCEVLGVQDREESEAGYTKDDWQAYRERTNDDAERRTREEAWR